MNPSTEQSNEKQARRFQERFITPGPDPSETVEKHAGSFDACLPLRLTAPDVEVITSALEALPVALRDMESELEGMLAREAEVNAAKERLARLEAGEFDPDKLTSAEVSDLMNTERAEVGIGSARVTKCSDRLEEMSGAIHARIAQCADVLKVLNNRATPLISEQFDAAVKPILDPDFYEHDYYFKQWKRELLQNTRLSKRLRERERALKSLTSWNPGAAETSTSFAKRRAFEAMNILQRVVDSEGATAA